MNRQWEQREHVIGSRVYVLMYTNMRTYFRLLIHCLFMCMSVTTCMRVHACKFHVCVPLCVFLPLPLPLPTHPCHTTPALYTCVPSAAEVITQGLLTWKPETSSSQGLALTESTLALGSDRAQRSKITANNKQINLRIGSERLGSCYAEGLMRRCGEDSCNNTHKRTPIRPCTAYCTWKQSPIIYTCECRRVGHHSWRFFWNSPSATRPVGRRRNSQETLRCPDAHPSSLKGSSKPRCQNWLLLCCKSTEIYWCREQHTQTRARARRSFCLHKKKLLWS